MRHFRQFLLELGAGFVFVVGRQVAYEVVAATVAAHEQGWGSGQLRIGRYTQPMDIS